MTKRLLLLAVAAAAMSSFATPASATCTDQPLRECLRPVFEAIDENLCLPPSC